jgi:hypothetical protein
VNAPSKASLLKALEQIAEVATASVAAATGTPMHPLQLTAILRHGHEQIRTLARAACGDRRWGRRPSMVPLPPKEDA